jgi:formylglycine-generating enzyme required for sulfatase activity
MLTPMFRRFSLTVVVLAALAVWPAACERPVPEAPPAPTPAPTPEPPPICRDCAVFGFLAPEGTNDQWQQELLDHLKADIRWNLKPRRPDHTSMVRVPAGEAIVGVTDSPLRHTEHLPRRAVRVASFFLDRTELSNAAYDACVAERQCLPIPHMPVIAAHWEPDRPALLSFKQAERYCLWAGKRLPTEIEWEAAARAGDARPFPWGDAPPTPERLNLCGKSCVMDWAAPDFVDGFAFTAPVDAFAPGDNPLGLRNTSGNVKEWATTEQELPADHFIARGGSWYSTAAEAPAWYRQVWRPGVRVDDKGVRCAASVNLVKTP